MSCFSQSGVLVALQQGFYQFQGTLHGPGCHEQFGYVGLSGLETGTYLLHATNHVAGDDFLRINAFGQCPAGQLDRGFHIARRNRFG